jgi:phosphatidate phosphatase APP1
MAAEPAPRVKVLWIARLEYRFHAWRERRARARGLRASVSAYPGYGGEDWVRVLGRVLIVPPVRARRRRGDDGGVRGWRSFAAVPVGYATVTVSVDGVTHEVIADRGGVIDAVLPARLQPGWQPLSMTVEGSEPFETRVRRGLRCPLRHRLRRR